MKKVFNYSEFIRKEVTSYKIHTLIFCAAYWTERHFSLVLYILGAFLPPDEADLQIKYKEELREVFGIEFNSLFTMTNMPIKRFADFLVRRGEMASYMELLVRNFNPGNVDNLMCRNLLSINYDGAIFDCDFK